MPLRSVGTSASGATLVTDKDDYMPGDTLRLSGTGWQGGDTLDIVLDETPQNHPPVAWSIGVADNGTLSDTSYVVQESDLGVTFSIVGKSRATGDTVQATFTDGSMTFRADRAGVTMKYARTDGASCSSTSFTAFSSTTDVSVNNATKNSCWEVRAPTSVVISGTTYTFAGWTAAVLGPGGETLGYTSQALGDTTQSLKIATSASGTNGTITANYTGATPDLSITKTANSAATCDDGTGDTDFCTGIQATYTLTVSNTGTAATSGTITVTDTLPSQLTYVNSTAGDWTCGAVAQLVTCTTTAAIAATNGTKDLTLKVMPNAVQNDVINRASVIGGGDNTSVSSANSQVDIHDPPAPILTITKTANSAATCDDATSDTDFCFGTQATYTLTVSNTGSLATSGTITVTDTLPGQLTYVNSTAGDWTCGAVAQLVTCTTTSVIAATSGTKDLTLKVMPNAVHNDVINRASVVGGGDNSSASSANSQVDIQPAPTSTTLAVSPATQQYSDTTVFTATVTPYELLSQQLTGTVYFYVGASATSCGTTAPAGSVGSKAIADADDGVATFKYRIGDAPSASAYVVTACFYSSSTSFASSGDTENLTVSKEDATVYDLAYSPDPVQVTSGVTPTVTVSFKVRETNPELNSDLTLVGAGDLANASITVNLIAIGTPSNSRNNINTCLGTTTGTANTYTQVLNVTCGSITGLPVDTYDVQVLVGSYYVGEGEVVLSVTDPSLGFATGGGWFTLGSGDKVNFGFQVKATVNKQKTVYQGSLLVIRHTAEGDIRAKGNVFDGFAIQGNVVTFSGKATYSVNDVSLGNYPYAAYAQDNGTPGVGVDAFGLYLALAGNGIATSSDPSTVGSTARLLVGGNIQVPQPQGKK